jgi:hypothetical protein
MNKTKVHKKDDKLTKTKVSNKDDKLIENFDTDNDNIKEIVLSLRHPICYKNKCVLECNILYKCIYCKKYLSSNQWGPLLETYIKKLFLLGKPINHVSGDGRSVNGKTIEIKVSLGDLKGQFNFVQIRPDHDIDYYIFMCYNLNDGELGKVYWFLCPSNKLYKLLPKYGGYAHGTIQKFGKIELSNIYGHKYEYALSPTPTSNTKLWKKLIKLFSCDEKYIMTQLT